MSAGHALECHHRDGTGILGDFGLIGGDDVHDDAALEHLGHAALDARGAGRGDLVGVGRRGGVLLGHERMVGRWSEKSTRGARGPHAVRVASVA
jgi:hypothetical protein